MENGLRYSEMVAYDAPKYAMAKGEGLFWVMPVEKVVNQIITAIQKKKSKAYVTKRWHILAIINKFLPYCLYKRM